ncbi:MAG: LysM peptidoglycan-binding domain-containing protein [Desulfobacterales bacterium]|nr:LysM peptidoglycan-binding domain-containing protein [Desulfobacterales bacterium]
MKAIKHTLVVIGILCSVLFSGFSGAGAEPGEFYYTIQKGDTLWDLSQKFYNSQWDWPGLWELNQKIKNPHWIYPGNQIQIFYKGYQAISNMQAPPQQLPSPPQFSYYHMDYVGYIRSESIPSLGTVIEGSKGQEMISKGDKFYIKPSRLGIFKTGATYLVFATQPVEENHNEIVYTGVQHKIKARITILEDQGTLVLARADHGIREVSPGDHIMEYRPIDALLEVDDSPGPVQSTLICSEENLNMINDYKIAFIDKGRAHGIRPGQIRTIAQGRTVGHKTLFSEPPITLSHSEVGKAIVLRAEEATATIMVLTSSRDIHPGDMVQ